MAFSVDQVKREDGFMMNDTELQETCELISQMIQNKCVNPPGNEMPNIKAIESFLTERDIKCQVFESAPNRGNLVAKIRGSGKGPSLMFGPAHVDVVPVPNPEDWEVDPFSGEIKDGYIWGRGSLDMLTIVASQTQAFVKLHQEQFQTKGDLILLIVSDEETGGKYGAEWMLKNHPDLIQTDYAVTEFGGITIAPGKIIFAIGEKGANWKRISFKGTPGHGSMPYTSDNAIYKAGQATARLIDYCDNKIPITTEYLEHLADGFGLSFYSRFMLTNKRTLPFTLRRLRKKDSAMAKFIHALSRMTISPSMTRGGTKINIIPATASIDLDVRTLPGQDEEYVITHLQKALGDLADEAKIETITDEGSVHSYGNASPVSSDFVNAMKRAIQQTIPDSTFVPFMMMGGSDARFFRERNIDTYGYAFFDPRIPLNELTDLVHGTNERVTVKTVELTTKAYYNLAKEFLG